MMNTRYALITVFAGLAAQAANAQSTVTLYGILDEGITYLSNVGGSEKWVSDSGNMQSTRWGLRGREDLGGGNVAIFRLESGFALNNGTLAQGGALFGRHAYVGLFSRYGTLTLGRQYDFMGDSLVKYSNADSFAGGYDWHFSNVDRIAGQSINNSVKYLSPNFNGLTFGGFYAFGNDTGDFNASSSVSAGANYTSGRFSMGMAYTKVENGTLPVYTGLGLSSFFGSPVAKTATISLDKATNAGTGFSYRITDRLAISSVATWTQYRRGYLSSTIKIVDTGLTYMLRPDLQIGVGQTYATMDETHWNIYNAGVDYFLSKRTDVYFTGNFQHAVGGGAVAVLSTTLTPSSNSSEADLRIGLRHKF